jgi:glyoxylase-like metal-dependent hydrolase (beta-lactamase superfamily II)
VLETPGHAPDHVALAFGAGGETGVVCGDLAVAEGSVVVGGSGGDMTAYLDSLRRVRERDPGRLYPGHGPTIDDPETTLSRLIDHRLDRERSVLAAVEAGAETPEAVTDAAYDKDLSGVWDLAVATVVAHLEKLAAEGRIAFDGERARPP